MVPGPGIAMARPRRSSTRRTASRAAGATKRATAGARTCAASTWTGSFRAHAPRMTSSMVVTATAASRSRSAVIAAVGCFARLRVTCTPSASNVPRAAAAWTGRYAGSSAEPPTETTSVGRAGGCPRAAPAARSPPSATPSATPCPRRLVAIVPIMDPRCSRRRRSVRGPTGAVAVSFGLYDRLHRRYGPQRWWPARSRFEVVVGAILTQNAAWRNAERAIARLRAGAAPSRSPPSSPCRRPGWPRSSARPARSA